jgi:hypothetical protein
MVSKSYWSLPMALGSAPVYQFQPVKSVTWPATVQPSTPSAALSAALVAAISTCTIASAASLAPTSTRSTP